MGKLITILALCCVALALSACGQSPVSSSSGRIDTLYIIDTTSQPTGKLSGRVTMYAFVPPMYTESQAGGATVSIDGTGYRTTTDTSGHWEIGNLPPGNYTLTFHKDGYGDFKVFGQQVMGAGESYTSGPVVLVQIPAETAAASFSTATPITGIPDIECTFVYSPHPFYGAAATAFLGWNRTVSNDPATYRYFVKVAVGIDGRGEVRVEKRDLLATGFHYGDSLFIATYTGVDIPGATYRNPIFDVIVDPTVNPVRSQVVSRYLSY